MLNSKPRYIIHPSWPEQVKEDNIASAKRYPIEEMYEGKLRKVGQVLMGCCPFHEERTPSFAVYPEKNTWYCFGCASGGDAVSFYMKKTGCSFIQAIGVLKK